MVRSTIRPLTTLCCEINLFFFFFRYGTKRLGVGIFQGVSGVFTQPVKGAQKEGVAGFVKGVGKGLVGIAVKPVIGVTDFISSATIGASATTTAISEFTNQGKRRRRKNAHRTRTPRLMYGDHRLLKVYNEDESYVRAVILAIRTTRLKRKTKDNVVFDPQTLQVKDYITHVRFDSTRVCIITNQWVTCWNTGKFTRKYLTNTQKLGGGKTIELCFAVGMNAVGVVATTSDGQDVLISLGVSKNATTLVMEIGSAEMAATVVQRLNHIVVGGRNY